MIRRALPIALALVLAGCGSRSPEQQAESLHSLAAEGALLARDAADGRVTEPFTRVHSTELAKLATKLHTSSDARIASLATEVAADLERLGDASHAGQLEIARELEAAARATDG